LKRQEFAKLAGTIFGAAAIIPAPLLGVAEQTGWGATEGVVPQAHIDAYLTKLSTAFLHDQKDFISDKVFPVLEGV
jgi:hypothetical protein